LDSGKIYKIDASSGKAQKCDIQGNLIRPFDPKITGRFNFDERKVKVEHAKTQLGSVEWPHALGTNSKRNYLPGSYHLEGYA